MAYNNKYDITKSRYTHRDYESIKEDLIKTIPSLTQEWTSREDSDPGIVLIKLMSIFGDMLSYNIDKIALELYIQSVTQRKNCAKILELLGYKMHWYQSARVLAHIRLVTNYDENNNLIHFLMTPLKAIFKARDISYCVALQGKGSDQIDIYSSTETVPVKLIQGIPASVNFNKNDLINNRFYFNTLKVDETEFRLTVANAGRKVTCQLIDHLYLASDRSKLFYEFNVDDYDRPYIQLDEGWEDTVSSDNPIFTLQYIITDGTSGNIASNAFTSIINADEGSTSYKNLVVDNLDNSTKYGSDGLRLDSYNSPGKNPQSVLEAKLDSANYVFTHDTLVTSFDFERATKRIDNITVSKLVDVQVILNDHLDLYDICNRASDHFTYSIVGLPFAETLSDTTNTVAYIEIPEIKEPTYGQYFKIKFTRDFGISGLNLNPPGLLTINRELSHTEYYQEYTYPIYKTIDSINIEEGKEYILYFNPSVTRYTPPGEEEIVYQGRWDLYDNAEQITEEHRYLDHHMVIMYLGYKDFDWYSNSYYNSTFDGANRSPWRMYGADPYAREYYDLPDSQINKENAGYYPYKPLDNILQSERDLINDLYVLNVTVDFGTMKLFPFKVKGILHLIEPASPEETYQIYNIVNDTLKRAYYPDLHPIGEKPNFIELVDIIQGADSRIKYFDAIDNIVEWAPAIQTDLYKRNEDGTIVIDDDGNEVENDNYIDKIFDTTSAVRYNGLSDKFNFSKRFMTFKLKNTSRANFGTRGIKYGTEGQENAIDTSEDHTAYLFNYSRTLPGYVDDTDVLEIGYNMILTVETENIKQLEALCKDLKFNGAWIQNFIKKDPITGQPIVDDQGNYEYETNVKWIDNTGIHWQE